MIFWMEPSLRPRSNVNDADLYADVIGLEPTDDFHAKQGRSTGRYVLATATGVIPVYVKKYYSLSWWQKLTLAPRDYPGPLELANIQRAMSLGIKVAEPVAAGADPGQTCKSLLALHSLEGYVALHRYLPARWEKVRGSKLDSQNWTIFKRALITRIANIVQNMHSAHLFHRDLYLCHFFIRESPDQPDGFDLVLIDWGRLKESRWQRWRIKDLAQLLFSAKLPGITRSDCLRFYCEYLGNAEPEAKNRALLRRVLAKAAAYHRHDERSRRRAA